MNVPVNEQEGFMIATLDVIHGRYKRTEFPCRSFEAGYNKAYPMVNKALEDSYMAGMKAMKIVQVVERELGDDSVCG